ncbi:hypothetical protein [Nocardioides sp. CER19]|uniref:hypothetical protein n=1 Tax=Nocardioides sp. CER19 TaxID=3038538 RepID=UPI002448F076|nr:hypothetical protein [Nocardioides sp. CER19]MDH2415815.1 hypothetical protein [Nocardioides sp. CER19]
MSDQGLSSGDVDALLGTVWGAHCLEYKGSNLPLTISFPTRCPRAAGQPDHLNLDTGELRPPRCKANLCPYCVRVNRWRTCRAVGASCPTAFLTFTLVGDEWPVIQRRMNKLIERLRNEGYNYEWAWKVECFWISVKRPWGMVTKHRHHVHAFLHGESVPDEATLGAGAERVGFGSEFRFFLLTDKPEYAARYLWPWDKKIMEFHALNLGHNLHVNGGRLVHQSRNFWRYNGERMTSMDAVLKAERTDFERRRAASSAGVRRPVA